MKDFPHESVLYSNGESAGESANESAIVCNNSIVRSHLDLNVVIKEDSFAYQSPSIEKDTFQSQPCDYIVQEQSHMHILNLLAIGDGEKTLTLEEHGF